MPVNDKSISGNCVLNKKTYNLRSMEDTQELFGITHNSSFDESIGYKTINMLVIPMRNYKGVIIGVLQLKNKKDDANTKITGKTIIRLPEYTALDEQITNSLASQAAILLERTRLQENLTNLLDSMIVTLSTTLEQRDPVTAGHSKRVAEYSISLAKDRPYKPAISSEKAIKILGYDVKDGALDSNLVDLFVNKVINNNEG